MKKRLLALLLAATMAFALPMTAFATEDGTTQESGDAGSGDGEVSVTHKYDVYQIFSAASLDGTTLKNITWGSSVTSAEAKNAIAKAVLGTEGGYTEGDSTSAGSDTVLAEILAELSDSTKYTTNMSNYTTQTATNALAAKIADLVSENTIANPVATKVEADGSGQISTNGAGAGYYVVVDVTDLDGVNDTANYALLATTNGTITYVAKKDSPSVDKWVEDVNDSQTYQGESTISEGYGKTADHDIGDSIKFKLEGTLPSDIANYDTYKFEFHDTECSALEFDSNSVKVYLGTEDSANLVADSYYTVNTSTTDGCTFEIAFSDVKKIPNVSAGSKIIVTYNSELLSTAVIGLNGNENVVYLKYSNDYNSEGLGKSEEHKVIVFTYEVDAFKVDGLSKPLAGAKFKLYKKYVTAPSSSTETITVDGKTYYQVGSEIEVTMTSDAKYVSSFIGVDDGEYVLEESATPNDTIYNKIAPIVFTVSATHTEKPALTLSVNVNGTSNNGTLVTDTNGSINFTTTEGKAQTTIVNNTGSVLPSTGGIGTTIFYVIGGILIVGAGVLLFVKKRMSK